MTIIKELTTSDVLRYFLLLESQKPGFETILSWRDLSDAALNQRMRQWKDERTDTNPVLVWTVGNRSMHIVDPLVKTKKQAVFSGSYNLPLF